MRQLCRVLVLVCLVVPFVGCQKEPTKPHFVKEVDWIGKGQWLKADLHIHTKFSDGSHKLADVVDQAAANGCQVIAITDHADRNLTAATRPYIEEIEAARKAHPDMLVLAGLEWNVPPHGGDEHAKVLLPPSEKEGQLLSEFKAAFDDLGLDEHKIELAERALRWLDENCKASGIAPVVVYNHPNRKRDEDNPFIEEVVRLRAINPLIVGFEGGPGHQRAKRLGSYKAKFDLIDRWDPAVAGIGDAWDQLLGKGLDIWGAEASSDFHNADPKDLHDYWPGEFSETWVYAPEASIGGVLRALQAGTYFGAHGHIAREARILVDAPGLPRPAQAGETIAVPPDTTLDVSVECQVPPTDWEGNPNRLDTIELIAIDEHGAKEVAKQSVSETSPSLRTSIKPTGKFLVLRARGRRAVDNGPDLMFYTNPVRVVVE